MALVAGRLGARPADLRGHETEVQRTGASGGHEPASADQGRGNGNDTTIRVSTTHRLLCKVGLLVAVAADAAQHNAKHVLHHASRRVNVAAVAKEETQKAGASSLVSFFYRPCHVHAEPTPALCCSQTRAAGGGRGARPRHSDCTGERGCCATRRDLRRVVVRAPAVSAAWTRRGRRRPLPKAT